MAESVKRVRTCIGCGKKGDKIALHRIVKTADGAVAFDATGRVSGRGAYVCSVECYKDALKARKLQRALKTSIEEDQANTIQDALEAALNEA